MIVPELKVPPKPNDSIKEFAITDPNYPEGSRPVVRYTKSLPSKEVLQDLIRFGIEPALPYISAVLMDFEGEKEVAFADVRMHHDIVEAIEREKGRYVRKDNVGGDDWKQIQIYLEKESVRLSKIRAVGWLEVDEAMLLLGKINPELFVAGEIQIQVTTTSFNYVFNPLNRDLKVAHIIAGGETVIESLGEVKPLY